MYLIAFSSASIPSPSASSCNLSLIVSTDILLKSYLWHLDSIVTGILWTSVVARMNITYEGGSSSVFKRALNAPVESM